MIYSLVSDEAGLSESVSVVHLCGLYFFNISAALTLIKV